ncbi:hypothetical protein [Thalassiella azotivora]
MSKERARRRAEREAAAEAERARRERAAVRRGRVTALVPARLRPDGHGDGRRRRRRPARRPRPDSPLRRRRRRQDGTLLAALVALHSVLWLLSDSWTVRISAAVLTLMAWPVLVTVLFDRRSPT